MTAPTFPATPSTQPSTEGHHELNAESRGKISQLHPLATRILLLTGLFIPASFPRESVFSRCLQSK